MEARQYASQVGIRIEQAGDRITVEAKYPKAWRSSREQPHVLVHFEIVAPQASDITAKAENGPLHIEGIKGRLELSTSDAELVARGCSGLIKARTTEGSLTVLDFQGEVEASTLDGAVKVSGMLEALESQSTNGRVEIRVLTGSVMKADWAIHAGNGNVHLYLPDSLAADIDVTTGEGMIVTDHSMEIDGSLSNRRLTGRMNGGGKLLRIHTSDGDIHILR